MGLDHQEIKDQEVLLDNLEIAANVDHPVQVEHSGRQDLEDLQDQQVNLD